MTGVDKSYFKACTLPYFLFLVKCTCTYFKINLICTCIDQVVPYFPGDKPHGV